MSPYELILLFDPNLGEEKISQVLGKIEDKVKSQGGEVDKVEKWGARRVASLVRKVKNMTQAYYVLVRFHGETNLPAELSSFLKVTEAVVRYFISRAVVMAPPQIQRREMGSAPANAIPVGEIEGEPLGKPE